MIAALRIHICMYLEERKKNRLDWYIQSKCGNFSLKLTHKKFRILSVISKLALISTYVLYKEQKGSLWYSA